MSEDRSWETGAVSIERRARLIEWAAASAHAGEARRGERLSGADARFLIGRKFVHLLAGADLEGADFQDADLTQVSFSPYPGTLYCVRDQKPTNLAGADFSGAKLIGAGLSDVTLAGAVFGGADLTGANWAGANLERAVLSGASLQHADLGPLRGIATNLKGAILTTINIFDPTDLKGANLQKADLRNADLRGADFGRSEGVRSADLTGADLSGADLSESYMTIGPSGEETPLETNLDQTVLKGANLTGADLRHAFLKGADLQDSRLEGANLVGACLAGANLHRAFLDHRTRLEMTTFFTMPRRDDVLPIRLADVRWNGASLTGLKDLGRSNRLGDDPYPTWPRRWFWASTPAVALEGQSVSAGDEPESGDDPLHLS